MLEAQIKDLQTFQQRYFKIWGALSPEDLVTFNNAEKQLLSQDPVLFMEKNHDAIFNRRVIEANLAQYRASLEAAEERIKLAEVGAPQLATMKRKLEDQKDQTAIQAQKVRRLEDELEAVRYQLKTNDMHWKQTGEEKDALQAQIEQLTSTVIRLESELSDYKSQCSALRADPETFIRAEYATLLQKAEDEHRKRRMVDVDCVIASLNAQILDLKAKYQREVQLRKQGEGLSTRNPSNSTSPN